MSQLTIDIKEVMKMYNIDLTDEELQEVVAQLENRIEVLKDIQEICAKNHDKKTATEAEGSVKILETVVIKMSNFH